MIMNVNFNGFGENAATFIADKTITEAGVPVKMKDNGTVAKCDASENFCGVCVSVRGGYAVVQLSGYVKVKSDKKIAVGYKKLSATAGGGVAVSKTGREEPEAYRRRESLRGGRLPRAYRQRNG